MLIVPPPTIRRRGRVIQPASSPAPPPPPGQPLVCEDGDYDYVNRILTLYFDRAVDVSGFVGSQLTVSDGTGYQRINIGSTATLISDNQMQIQLVAGGAYEGSEVLLNATGLTGIVAVDDGGLWPGAVNEQLPFGGVRVSAE